MTIYAGLDVSDKTTHTDKAWAFSPSKLTEAGLTVGRFTGTITEGKMQVSTDGSYVVRGEITLSLGDYNFNEDGRSAFENALIRAGSVYAGDGKTFVAHFAKTGQSFH